jgi:hypothetical protein
MHQREQQIRRDTEGAQSAAFLAVQWPIIEAGRTHLKFSNRTCILLAFASTLRCVSLLFSRCVRLMFHGHVIDSMETGLMAAIEVS